MINGKGNPNPITNGKGARAHGANNLAYSILKSLDDRRMRNGLLVRFQHNMQMVQGNANPGQKILQYQNLPGMPK